MPKARHGDPGAGEPSKRPRRRKQHEGDEQPASGHRHRRHEPHTAVHKHKKDEGGRRPRTRRPKSTTTSVAEWTAASLAQYDRIANRWVPLDPSTLPDRAPLLSQNDPRLRLLTYNTFSGDPSHTQSQTRALLAILERAQADLISLQEVSEGFYRALQGWAASRKQREAEWVLTRVDEFWHKAGPEAQRGPKRKRGQREACVLLVRRGALGGGSAVRFCRLETARDEGSKAAIGLSLSSGGQERVRLVTSHFSALPERAALRSRQYQLCADFLAEGQHPASHPPAPAFPRVFLGDTNASSASELDPLTSDARLGLVDAARVASSGAVVPPLRPGASETDADFRAAPTFGHLYPYVRAGAHSRPRKVRRIDRVYVSSAPSSTFRSSPALGRSSGGASSAAMEIDDAQTSDLSAGAMAAEVLSYDHLGSEPLEGKDERDRLGRDGRRYASDHEAVVVELRLYPKAFD